MDGKELDREYRAADPSCPPCWRAKDARHRAAGRRPKWSPHGDPDVAAYAKFLRALRAAQTKRGRMAVWRKRPTIALAHRIYRQDSITRWLIEAYVLAGLPDEKVGARCGVAADVVKDYASIFFDARNALKAGVWLMHYVVGRGWQNGFGDDEVRQLWAWCALAGGTVIVDYLARTLREVLEPGEEPSLGAYLRPSVPLRLQAFVAGFIIPPFEEALAFFEELHVRLRVAETLGNSEEVAVERDRARVDTVRFARAVLEGRRLPRRTWLKRQRAAIRKRDGSKATETSRLALEPGLMAVVDTIIHSR